MEIVNSLAGNPNARYWVGADDWDHEGVWKWVDGTLVRRDDMHWSLGQPDNHGSGGEDCAEIIGIGSWNWKTNDEPCTAFHLALCEIPVKC